MAAGSEYPKQRQMDGRVYTPSGFLYGKFHLPEGTGFLDYLNGAKDFFTMTEVKLPNQSRPLPFLALQRRAAYLIVPGTDEWVEVRDASSISQKIHRVSCLFPGWLLMGTLSLPPDRRVSDHLLGGQRFIILWNCTIGLDAAGAQPTLEANPIVIANAATLIGVAEM